PAEPVLRILCPRAWGGFPIRPAAHSGYTQRLTSAAGLDEAVAPAAPQSVIPDVDALPLRLRWSRTCVLQADTIFASRQRSTRTAVILGEPSFPKNPSNNRIDPVTRRSREWVPPDPLGSVDACHSA